MQAGSSPRTVGEALLIVKGEVGRERKPPSSSSFIKMLQENEARKDGQIPNVFLGGPPSEVPWLCTEENSRAGNNKVKAGFLRKIHIP